MPRTEVLIFAEGGVAPLLQWMDGLPVKVRDKLLVRIERLAELGHELRRPEADFLRDGIHELRTSFQNVNYRILYFFHKQRAVLSHGCTKEDVVPPKEIDTAVVNMQRFTKNPTQHTHEE
jgi:phage-related protein